MTLLDQPFEPFLASAKGTVEGQRATMIDAAVTVFSRTGYREAELGQIASQAQISEADLLRHFPSKDALLAAALTRRDQTVRNEVWAGAAGEGWQGIEAWVELMRNNMKQRGTVRFFSELRLEASNPRHPANDWLVGHHELVDEVVERAVRTGTERGEMVEGIDAHELAIGLLAMIEGLETRWMAVPRGFDPGKIMSDYVALLRWRYGTEGHRTR